jgi:truncated hemoglobin YjbI
LPVTPPKTWGAYVDALAARLLNQSLRPEHREAVLTFMNKSATATINSDLNAYNDGWFSWQLPTAVALILDSPYHEMR